MAVFEWMFAIGALFLIGSTLVRSTRNSQQQERLQNAFYELLESGDGCITLLQLAVTARVDGELARQFLDQQAKVFNAEIEVDKDAETFYRFPKLWRNEVIRNRNEW
jgi:hypothetical protein